MLKKFFLLLLLFPLWVEGQVLPQDTAIVLSSEGHNLQPDDPGRMALGTEDNFGKGNRAVQKSGYVPRKLRLGTNLGLSLSKNYTYLSIGPQVGYQFNNYLMAGGGISYYHHKATMSNYVSRGNILGTNLFGYVYPLRFFTIFLQPEINYIRSRITYTSDEADEINRSTVPSLVVGGGIRIGRSHITLNYDLVQNENSPHEKGWYMGFSTFF